MSASIALANNIQGAWSPLGNWPLIAAHAVLTSDGRVLTYGTDGNGNQTGYFIYDVWDPSAGLGGGHLTLPNTTGTDIFCSSQVLLPQSGNVFVVAGDNFVNSTTTNTGNNNTNIYSVSDNTLARGNNLNRARWYSSTTTLLNGEIYIQGGNGGADFPEVRSANGLFRLLTGANTSTYLARFPRNFVAPDGRIFGFDVAGKMYYVSTGGTGSIVAAGQIPAPVAWTSSAVMFQPGRIIQMGGASASALIIDINGPTPVVSTTQPMSSQRQWVSATVLPDGRVLGTGGSDVENELIGVNNTAAIWNPRTGQWLAGTSGQMARLYHSSALLLPDATVLVTGGGAPGPLNNLNAEIYYPPYLYNASGGFASRPSIVSAPDAINIGDNFLVGVANTSGIDRVTLVKTSSATHSVNMDQRFIELPFSATGAMLTVQPPARATDAPPGYYMLFVLNAQGVPSVAKILRMNIAGSQIPAADYTQAIGGNGGDSFQLACNAGEVLVGIHGSSDTFVNQVGPQCVRIDANGDWIDTPVNRSVTGTSAGTPFEKTCPVNYAINGFRGRASQFVDEIDVQCRALTASGKVTGGAQFLGAVGGTGGTEQGPYHCGTDNPGYALFGRSGSRLDSFGVQCRQAVTTQTNTPPAVVNPGSRSGAVGVAVNLLIAASDADDDVLTFGASGLPSGLNINTGTGRITGTPTTDDTYNVTVTVSDGAAESSAGFSWTVAAAQPFVLEPLLPATPVPVNTPITYTANATNGVDVQYQWYFDDGTTPTAFSTSPTIEHAFDSPGVYYVTVTAVDASSPVQAQTVVQLVHRPLTSRPPNSSSNIAYEPRGNGRVWVVNQDNDSVTVFNAATNAKLAEIPVGAGPRALAVAPDGRIWVTNKFAATVSIIDADTLGVTQTLALPFASQPFGIAFAPAGGAAFVTLEAAGKLLKFHPTTGALLGSVSVGANPRHLAVSADGNSVYVSRFITPPLPGENTATVQANGEGGEVLVVGADSMNQLRTIVLRTSTKPDFENQGSGVPNYLGAPVISPDGESAWVPSKQDNILRGMLRSGSNLNFQSTVRAVSSRIDLAGGTEEYAARLDHDNSGLASAVAFDPYGVYMFVALETSREVAVVDAHGQWEIFRFDVGRAPQGLVVSPDGSRLYVNNFTDRTVGVFDLTRLIENGESSVPAVATIQAVTAEKLSAQVLRGKRLFYDARDVRLSRDRYISCAACHNDGGQDGRVWDLSGFGEGLRNTVPLRGRAGAQGFLHWTANFDEVQDFEGQIRNLSGGTGLMTDAAFDTGTRSQTLGDPKAGVSADLDALAAYVESLSTFANSPVRNSGGSLTAAAVAGKQVFNNANCAQCHSGAAFTESAGVTLRDIGTLKPTSGLRLGGPLEGFDTPTLRDVWATAPYLHDGSALTLADAVLAHNGVSINATDLANLTAYLAQIGGQETAAPLANNPPQVTNPGNRSNIKGVALTLTIVASDPQGSILSYSANGLPAGLSLNALTGKITGTPTTVKTNNVVITVSDGELSSAVSFTWAIVSTTDTTAPTIPQNFAVTLITGNPRLSWTASTDNKGVAGYAIFRSLNGTMGVEFARTTQTVWIDTSVSEGTTYTYSVKAYDAAGNFSGRTPLKTIKASQAPSKPIGLTVALVTNKPQLKWTASTDNVGVVGYIIYRSTTSGVQGPEVARTSATSWRDAAAVKGKKYWYALKAYDAAGNLSARSAFVSVISK